MGYNMYINSFIYFVNVLLKNQLKNDCIARIFSIYSTDSNDVTVIFA